MRRMTFVLLLLATCTWAAPRWSRDVTRKGIEFEKYRQSSAGTHIGDLPTDQMIEGFQVQRGWVHFYPDWTLKFFQISADTLWLGNSLPAHSWIKLDCKGTISTVCLPRDMTIQGYPVNGSGGPKGAHTCFYPSGKLRSFFATEPLIVDGVSCKTGVLHLIALHENGRLKQATLKSGVTIGGKKFNRGQTVYLDSLGGLRLPDP